MPGYRYAIAGVTEDLKPEDTVFSAPLPASRHPGSGNGNFFSCGFFLHGVAAFLERNRDILETFCGESPEDILISLEKHGAFYHPCRVVVNGKKDRSLVVNAAVRKEASRVLRKETEALKKLFALKIPHLPEVLAAEEILFQGRELSFFLAPWFSGFHEFHWSTDSGDLRIHVWEEDGRRTILPSEDAGSLFEKATAILARAYDIEGFSQIFPWHHAAGDFVVRLEKGSVDEVRLISVRQYESMIDLDPEKASFGDLLDGLLYFFLNTVLRMRVDRLDGIGDLLFAPESVLPLILKGFFRGLGENPMVPEKFSMILEMIPELVRQMGEDGLLSMYGEILRSYHPGAPEQELLRNEIEAHSRLLFTFFR